MKQRDIQKLSEHINFLEEAFDILNEKYFNSSLSTPVITVQESPNAFGHFTPYKSWANVETEQYEINIGAENLSRPLVETLSTLMHEMVHQFCHEHDIKDTSRGSTYHNKKFKEQAEKRDLLIGFNKKIGHSLTTPSEEFILFVNTKWEKHIELHRKNQNMLSSEKTNKPSSTRKYICPTCGMSVRATKNVNIGCLDCDSKMIIED